MWLCRYAELFARAVSHGSRGALIGAPFVLAAVLDMLTAQLAVPWAFGRLGFEPSWEHSAMQQPRRKHGGSIRP